MEFLRKTYLLACEVMVTQFDLSESALANCFTYIWMVSNPPRGGEEVSPYLTHNVQHFSITETTKCRFLKVLMRLRYFNYGSAVEIDHYWQPLPDFYLYSDSPVSIDAIAMNLSVVRSSVRSGRQHYRWRH